MSSCRLLPAILVLALAACGDLPQPYRGRPGGQAGVLSIPLAMRLAVPPPPQALLGDAAARDYAGAMATALQAQDVPAVALDTPLPLDWLVELTADRQGQAVRPRFRLLDGDRRPQASSDGTPVPLDAWANADRVLFDRIALEAAPKLTQLLLQVEAGRKRTDPASLAAGPPRLRMDGVRGAPGDGNTALAARMRDQLGKQGFVVQDTADGAGYGLQAAVQVVAGGRGKERVEIQWIVSRRDGEELGRVVQINEIPLGRLNTLWGDVAYAVAEEAADGVRTVVANAMQIPVATSDAPALREAAVPARQGAAAPLPRLPEAPPPPRAMP